MSSSALRLEAQDQNMKHLWWSRAAIGFQVTETIKATFPLLNLCDLITPDCTLKQ